MSEEEVIDLVARTKMDMHLVECTEAREKFDRSLNNLYKLVRTLGIKIIIGLLVIVGALLTLSGFLVAKQVGIL